MTWGEWIRENVTAGWLLAAVLIGVASYLWITQGSIPESLVNLLSIIIAFYFGQATVRIGNGLRELRKRV